MTSMEVFDNEAHRRMRQEKSASTIPSLMLQLSILSLLLQSCEGRTGFAEKARSRGNSRQR